MINEAATSIKNIIIVKKKYKTSQAMVLVIRLSKILALHGLLQVLS
jgi:hypothetical protein